jgi:hypothetical protein
MKDQLRRPLAITARVLSEKDGTVEYTASDATLDSYQESILPGGWKFTHFQKNAPFVDSHNYYTIENLLGRVTSARVEGGALIETVTWAKDVAENKLAVLGWKMTLGGFLRAVSVGFRVVKSVVQGGEGWNAAVAAAGLPPEDAAKCRRIFLEQEQLELSACILGANPAAVARAHSEGCVSDADLAAVGFTDDDMHFLSLAGKATENPDLDPLIRAMVAREMGRITKRNSPGIQTPANGSPAPDQAARDARAMVLQAERKEFLRQLNEAVKFR